jgi:hypothetical protein
MGAIVQDWQLRQVEGAAKMFRLYSGSGWGESLAIKPPEEEEH